MKKSTFYSVVTVLVFAFLILNFSTNFSSSITLDGIINTAYSKEKPKKCDNERCDYRGGGEDYGCILDAPDVKCYYQNNTCTGYEPCDE